MTKSTVVHIWLKEDIQHLRLDLYAKPLTKIFGEQIALDPRY